MSDTSAKIRGKGLEHTGVTEDYANQMYDSIGAHYVGVVSLQVVQHAVDVKGKRTVELAIDTIEIAPNDDTAEHIRRLTRAFHTERKLAVNGGDQLPIEGGDEPTVEQVRAAGRAHEADPEADERDLENQEAGDAAADAADVDPASDDGDIPGDPWDEGPPAATVASPFDIPEPEPAA